MFSNDWLIELTINYFYYLFDYSWTLKRQFNRYKLILFIWFMIFNYCYLEFYLSSLRRWFLTYLSALIVLAFIDPETCPQFWLEIVSRPYPNRTYEFSHPSGCVRSWRGWQLGVQACLLQLVALLNLKYSSSSLFKPFFVDCWLVCFIFIGLAFIDPETCPQAWFQKVSGMYPNQKYGFSSTRGLWKFVARVPVFGYFTCWHQYIYRIQVSSSSLNLFWWILEIDL